MLFSFFVLFYVCVWKIFPHLYVHATVNSLSTSTTAADHSHRTPPGTTLSLSPPQIYIIVSVNNTILWHQHHPHFHLSHFHLTPTNPPPPSFINWLCLSYYSFIITPVPLSNQLFCNIYITHHCTCNIHIPRPSFHTFQHLSVWILLNYFPYTFVCFSYIYNHDMYPSSNWNYMHLLTVYTNLSSLLLSLCTKTLNYSSSCGSDAWSRHVTTGSESPTCRGRPCRSPISIGWR